MLKSSSAFVQIAVVPVTPFQQNCSVIWCEKTRQAAIVDPGGDLDQVLQVIEDEKLTLSKILLTHAHLDHCAAHGELAKRFDNLPIEGPHRADLFWIELLPEQARQFGMGAAESFMPTRWLHDGDTVTVGEWYCRYAIARDTRLAMSFFSMNPARFAIVGDVIFAGSIGRTDFPRRQS